MGNFCEIVDLEKFELKDEMITETELKLATKKTTSIEFSNGFQIRHHFFQVDILNQMLSLLIQLLVFLFVRDVATLGILQIRKLLQCQILSKIGQNCPNIWMAATEICLDCVMPTFHCIVGACNSFNCSVEMVPQANAKFWSSA